MGEQTEPVLIQTLCLQFLIYNKHMKKIHLTICLILFSGICMGQIDANLLLGLVNATSTEMNAISGPILGSILYNTTENSVYQYNGSTWVNVATNSTNLATENLTQDNETRTYDLNSQNIGFTNGKVGVGTNTPNSTLQTSGSFAAAIRTTSTNTNLTENDFTLIMTAKNLIITLPAANSCTGRIYVLRNIGNGDNKTSINYLKGNGDPEDKLNKDDTYWLQSDGTNWHLLIKI